MRAGSDVFGHDIGFHFMPRTMEGEKEVKGGENYYTLLVLKAAEGKAFKVSFQRNVAGCMQSIFQEPHIVQFRITRDLQRTFIFSFMPENPLGPISSCLSVRPSIWACHYAN